jgi:Sortase and related acyltransferases
MSYNHAWGGVIPFPQERWAGWYDRWVVHPEGKRYYRYLKDAQDRFVGEIAYHLDSETASYIAHVMIYAKYRRRGYGGEALEMLCAAAKENGLALLYDDIAADNPAAALFIRHGFTEAYRTEEKIMLKRVL